ncbi:hypothetical protein ABZ814_22705 [Micromonospora musae]|uniref:hypothetical protein n=1 Tax=Micromonospora musae TaxID=1894970 RepID=UPI0033F278DC
MTTKTACRSTTHHGTYWAYDKYGCRCLNAAVDASRIRQIRRNGPTGLIRPALGAVRTARGLAAYGCTVKQIALATGLSDRLIAQLQAGKDTIRASKDRQLRVVAERLIASPPPTGGGATRARLTAQRNGWFPLLAWDDIDDPQAQPNLGSDHRGDDYDPITVAIACDGRLTYQQIAAHWPDVIETLRRLATRMTDKEIADHLRWPGINERRGDTSSRGINTVMKLRQRHGIPAYTKPAAPVPYPPKRNRKAA